MEWLHEFTKCDAKKLNSNVPVSRRGGRPIYNVPVLWNGDVYMIDSPSPIGEGDENCKLVKYSISGDSWSSHAIPCDAKGRHRYEQAHALTTYRSKLLLIDSKVWEFDSTKSAFNPSRDITLPGSWRADLEIVSAASEGDYLLTSGKSRHNDNIIATVLLYDGKTWIDCKSPYVHSEIGLQVLIHNHSVLLIERLQSQNQDLLYIYETSLQSLIHNDPDLWQLLNSTPPIQSRNKYLSNFIVFRSHLFLLSVDSSRVTWWCYLSALESWQNVGSLNLAFHLPLCDVYTVNLPDDSVMMIKCEWFESFPKVYKLKPKGWEAVLEKLHSGMLQMKFRIRLYHNSH